MQNIKKFNFLTAFSKTQDNSVRLEGRMFLGVDLTLVITCIIWVRQVKKGALDPHHVITFFKVDDMTEIWLKVPTVKRHANKQLSDIIRSMIAGTNKNNGFYRTKWDIVYKVTWPFESSVHFNLLTCPTSTILVCMMHLRMIMKRRIPSLIYI